MRWQRTTIYAVLFVAWAAFSFWQHLGYRQQRGLIEEALHQSSHAIMNALVGGVRSHRRFGPFFEEQLQGMLDELVKTKDVKAAAVFKEDGQPLVLAGDAKQLPPSQRISAGERWTAAGFQLIESFQLRESPRGGGSGGAMGLGQGDGRGRGFGRGGPGWNAANSETSNEELQFDAILILDRTRADVLIGQAAWSRFWAVAIAAMLAVCLAFVWTMIMNLAEAKSRARVYETEMRHLRELSQAAAGLAHETRNPLGLIRGWTQRLADTALSDSERREFASTVMEECDRVTARINQFLTFARPRQPDAKPTNVAELASQLAVILQPDLESKSLTVTRQIAAEAIWVRADEDLLRQAVFNLLQNAIQFSPEGTSILLKVSVGRDGLAVLEVADQGPGVDEEHISSLFTPYFTTRPDGTGLGLAIVWHIVKLHDWSISYESGSPRGAVFSVRGIHVENRIHDSNR